MADTDTKVLTGASIPAIKSFVNKKVSQYVGTDILPNRNLFDKNTATVGNYIYSDSVIYGNNSVYSTSQRIDIPEGCTRLTFSNCPTNSGASTNFYDASLNIVGTVAFSQTETNKTVNVPTNAKYFITTINTEKLDSFKVEVGEEATGYVPYSPTLESIKPHSNRNFLDNPWFTVNQRGYSNYSGSTFNHWNEYCLDRWIFSFGDDTSSNIAVNSGYLGLNGDVWLYQKLESSISSNLNGKKVTVSVLYNDGTVERGICIFSNTSTFGIMETSNVKVLSTISSDGLSVIFFRFKRTVNVKAVKLELGSESTLAYDCQPNYADELAKCQRYYQDIEALGILDYPYNNGLEPLIKVILPVEMKKSPSLSIVRCATLNQGGGGQDFTSYSLVSSRLRYVSFKATFPSVSGSFVNAAELHLRLSADL